MPNQKLLSEWSSSVQSIHQASAGTPETYKLALDGLDIFVRFCKVKGLKIWEVPEVPALDVLIDIAPKIFDETGIQAIIKALNEICFEHYKFEAVESKLRLSSDYRNFYQSLSPNIVYKQTDLSPKLKAIIPEVDPTWVFYIWSQFNYLVRTKEKNRVYLQRNK